MDPLKANVIPLPAPRKPAEPTDEALLALCAEGDKDALALLFRRHALSVRRLAMRLVSPADAEDLLQSTFVVAWTQAGAFRGRSSVRTWLFAVAANLARKQHRSEGRRNSAFALLSNSSPAPERPVDEELDRRRLVARVERGIASLKHDLRVVYLMCEVECLPSAEVAGALGIRVGTVWWRLHQARQKLGRFVVEGGEE